MKKYKRTIVVAFGDTHGGHKLGLLNPDNEIIRNGTKTSIPIQNEVQNQLFKLYSANIHSCIDLADKDDIVVINLGDTTQGTKYSEGLFTTSIAEQISIAIANVKPWYEHKEVKAVRFAEGTSSHVFGDGTSEVALDTILSLMYPKTDTKVVVHGVGNIEGMLTDYAHHGPPPGRRTWLRGNEARYYLRDLMFKELNFGNKPPQLVLRGHHHSYIKEYLEIEFQGEFYESYLITIPSYCMLGEFAVQATASEFIVTNGMVACEVINGHLHKTFFFGKTFDIRTWEKIL